MYPDDSENEPSWISREEILEGLYARRAQALLYAAESRTAHRMARSRRTTEFFLSEEIVAERDLAFIEAFALARDPPVRPTIQDLERSAKDWGALIPELPGVRAALGLALAKKYRLLYSAIPSIRGACGLDDESVKQAFRRVNHRPLETIYARRPALSERVRNLAARLSERLESLSPFWTAFSLTLTETVGAGILALPIAAAGVGPLAGVAILILLGLVNILTVMFMAEAAARSGPIRFGNGYLGRMVSDYLGNIGSAVLSVGVGALCLVVLQAYYVGFSSTLQNATQVRAEVWTLILFLIGLYYIRQESLNATIASALAIGAVNIGLILLLCLVSLSRARVENLLYVNIPLAGGRPFDPSILQLTFGVILAAYIGHLSVSNCAKVVLRRDPSGRSLIWGAGAAMAAALALYSLWVLAVNGAIAPQALARESGTALAPLASQIGPAVHILGSAFVVLGIGMASVHFSLALSNLIRERLPRHRSAVVFLPRRQGRITLHGGGRYPFQIEVTYSGLMEESGRGPLPCLRLEARSNGNVSSREVAVADRLEEAVLDELLGSVQDCPGTRTVPLGLEVLDANSRGVRLQISSPLKLTYEGDWHDPGFVLTDILTLPDSTRDLLTWLLHKRRAGAAEVAARIGRDERATRAVLSELVEQGLVREIRAGGELHYQPQFAFRRARQLPEGIWTALREGRAEKEQAGRAGNTPFAQRLTALAAGEWGRYVLSASPVALAFVWTEWLLLSHQESFSAPINLVGMVIGSLLAGIFPVLLVFSSRRKGELVPALGPRLEFLLNALGHPVLLGGIGLLFLVSIWLHGLVIWRDPLERAIALAAGVSVIAMVVGMARRNAFASRAIVELCLDNFSDVISSSFSELRGRQSRDSMKGRPDMGRFAVTARGHLLAVPVRLYYLNEEEACEASNGSIARLSSLRCAVFRLPERIAAELEVWVHRNREQEDGGLPACAEVHSDSTPAISQPLSEGRAFWPLRNRPCELKIALPQNEKSNTD